MRLGYGHGPDLMPVRHACLGLFLGVFAACSADFSQLERVVSDELKSTHTPGAAVAVVSGDRVIFAGGFGVASVETGAPVTPDMLFRLGSTTKMFTAATLVSLAEDGKVDLKQHVSAYIKNLPPKLARITAAQLLSHTAGIIDDAPMFGSHDDSALAANVRSWGENYAFTDPGRIFSYSNPGYVLAGYLAEVVSGRPFADAVAGRVLRPLGMTRSTFRPVIAMTYPLAQGHSISATGEMSVIRPAADYAGAWPAGSLFSSVDELTRFVIAFLNKGVLDGRQVLSPELIGQLSTPIVAVPGGEVHYAFGLEEREDRGVMWVEHSGSRAGYGSAIRMAPERRFGVIVLGNKSGASLPKTAEIAAELVLGLDPQPEPKPKAAGAMAEAEMRSYVGRYVNFNETREIILRGGRLVVRLGGKDLPLARSADGHLVTQGAGEIDLVPVPARGTPEFLFTGFRAFKRL